MPLFRFAAVVWLPPSPLPGFLPPPRQSRLDWTEGKAQLLLVAGHALHEGPVVEGRVVNRKTPLLRPARVAVPCRLVVELFATGDLGLS
uniref:Uncharacterized protein n=1 Tax=Chromera velia CCMP2878 TaxID=1169474 RepID=A0A0G4H4K1_9ALVE|eukprot:Cvel_840.t1-p1 / transcript=Cvel_840.t1 / gene=Cvel_840 / organism=Chromera_velia_CCMP2878 / gene_product=hypothetical protein / transcript_product=hypothetical protein / location=Cvel_scaffold26:66443-66706(-) / protein_length=88 / sequence_SO=supercontig / SO=protein_coding / is_pseudo=false